MKVCEEKFPVGSYKGQKGPGYYMTEQLKANVDLFVRNIDKDMQFVGIVTGNGTVGNGKSTIAQQVGYYFSDEMSKRTGKNITFDENNIIFKSEELQERAFKVEQYSCLILDEGDDLTAHYFSKLARDLKRFFRKCRQLNLFIILILPDFFELPKSYAIVRSNFLINVKFMGEFKRGFYDFYGPTNKKNLYLNGKKNLDYSPKGVIPDFNGRFVDLYTIDEEIYRKLKYDDMKYEDDKPEKREPKKQEIIMIYGRVYDRLTVTHSLLSECFGIKERTGKHYYKNYKGMEGVHLGGLSADKNN